MTPEQINEIETAILDIEINIFIIQPVMIQQNASSSNQAIETYAELRDRLISQELNDELIFLRTCLDQDPEHFSQRFKDRCQVRAEQNNGTCLSLSALPTGTCNKVYWRIAEVLFQPASLLEMFDILLPEGMQQVTFDLVADVPKEASSEQKRQAFKTAQLKLVESPLNCLQGVNIDELNHLIIVDKYLLDVRDVHHLDFSRHQDLYNNLHHHYPQLAKQLYQRNMPWKQLSFDINTLQGKGLTHYEILENVIGLLRAGGSSVTKKTEATGPSQVGAFKLFDYINSLTPKTYELICTVRADGYSISRIASDIKEYACVEQSASRLQRILDCNPMLFRGRTHLSPQEQQTIEAKYSGKQLFPSDGQMYDWTLPKQANEYLAHINLIGATEGYKASFLIHLLNSFPPECYTNIFAHIQLGTPALSPLLGTWLGNGVLNQEQQRAFNLAIIANKERMGGLPFIINFALSAKREHLLLAAFSELPLAELIDQIRTIPVDAVSSIVTNEEKLSSFCQALGENAASIIPILLHRCRAEHCIQAVLSAFFIALTLKNKALAHELACMPEFLNGMKQLNETQEQQLHSLVSFLNSIRQSLPQESAMQIRKCFIKSLILTPIEDWKAAQFNREFTFVFPEAARWISAHLPMPSSANAADMLHTLVAQQEQLTSLFSHFPTQEAEDLAALYLQHETLFNYQSIINLLRYLPPAEQVVQVFCKIRQGTTLAHRLIKTDIEIFKSISSEQLCELLNTRDQSEVALISLLSYEQLRNLISGIDELDEFFEKLGKICKSRTVIDFGQNYMLDEVTLMRVLNDLATTGDISLLYKIDIKYSRNHTISKSLITILQSSRYLRYLTFNLYYYKMSLDSEVIQQIFTALKNNKTPLQLLNLKYLNPINKESTLILVEFLKSNDSLVELNLSGCGLEDELVALIVQALSQSPARINKLDLSGNYIGEKTINAFASWIEKPYCTLESLFIHNRCNYKTSVDVMPILDAIGINHSLLVVNLGVHTELLNSQADLIDVLAQNSTLIELRFEVDVACSKSIQKETPTIGQEIAQAFKGALRHETYTHFTSHYVSTYNINLYLDQNQKRFIQAQVQTPTSGIAMSAPKGRTSIFATSPAASSSSAPPSLRHREALLHL